MTAVFVLLNCGYFLPYGGSPGPRFLIPALPFLAVGLGPAFAWRPRLTAALALVSVVAMTAVRLVWNDTIPLRGGVLGELVHVPVQLGSSHFVRSLEPTVFGWATPGDAWGAAAAAIFALAAFVVALRTVPREPAREGRERRGPGRLQLAGGLALASIVLVAAAEASSVLGYPYRRAPWDLVTSIQGSAATVDLDQEVDFVVTASNSSPYQGYARVVLTIQLPRGMRLRGPPAYERGTGCRGTTTVRCSLDDLSPKMSTAVRLGVIVTRLGPQTVTAFLSAGGVPQPSASFTADGA